MLIILSMYVSCIHTCMHVSKIRDFIYSKGDTVLEFKGFIYSKGIQYWSLRGSFIPRGYSIGVKGINLSKGGYSI